MGHDREVEWRVGEMRLDPRPLVLPGNGVDGLMGVARREGSLLLVSTERRPGMLLSILEST